MKPSCSAALAADFTNEKGGPGVPRTALRMVSGLKDRNAAFIG